MAQSSKALPRAKAPECLGISSETVTRMLNHLNEKMLFHSLMIVRHGKVAAECYRYPFNKDIPHTMYSVSKTITATAVGFAISEGYLRLDTRLIDIFPEYAPKSKDERFEKLKIEHLLTMTSGKMPSYLLNKADDDWLKHLFNAKWIADPGTKFDYVNENIFTLCAALQRVTGETVVDYLYPRLFEPLGIDKPFWETDRHGVESGGWGIYLKTEDITKIMYCYMHEGKWKGKQIIPKAWAIDAVKPQGEKKGQAADSSGGYGYCIWIGNENEFRADGMYCQISSVLKEQDTVVTITSCFNDETPYWEALNMLKEDGFVEENTSARPSPEYTEFINGQFADVVPATPFHSPMEELIENRSISFKKSPVLNLVGFPMSVLSIAALYMGCNRAGNIDNVRFTFNGDEGTFYWQEGAEANCITFGMDGKYRFSPIVLAGIPLTAACAAFWRDNYTLEVWLRPVESLAKRVMSFTIANGEVIMTPSSDPPLSQFVESVAGFVKEQFKQKQLKDLADAGLKKLEMTIENVHYGQY